MALPEIRERFPLGDRISLALFGCFHKLTPIEEMKKRTPLFKFEEQYKDEKYNRMALKLKILETGSLLLDPKMIHPFVKIHVVDMGTCKYLAKSKALQPGVANKESVGFIDSNKKYT